MKMKNLSKFIAIIGFTVFSQWVIGQVTVTMIPSRDAYLHMALKPGCEYYANSNYGNSPNFYSGEWSASGYRVNQRSLMDFNVASLPADAVIIEARLSLYSMSPQLNDDYRHSSSLIRPNSIFKSNASYLERITGTWGEYTVTYNTQPASSTVNRVQLHESQSFDESYVNFDVTALVRDMINFPGTSNGILIRLTSESKYSRMAFCSKEHADSARWPRLTIKYTISDRLSTFFQHNLILKTNGTLWGWGANSHGELGDGTITEKKTPVQIGGNDWKQASAGYNHTLAIKNDGTLWAWGFNVFGELGDGTSTDRHTPTMIGTENKWRQVIAGYHYSFAIKTDGTLWSWGYNDCGQLGNGTTVSAYVPTKVGTSSDWKMVVTKKNYALAIKNDSTLWAWGTNDYSQLGDGTRTAKTSPVQIGTDKNWKTVSAGWDHALAIKGDGTLWAWGNNNYGQGGDSLFNIVPAPRQVGKDHDWKEVSAGFQHSLAMKADGTVWAWGYDYFGQLGDGMTGSATLVPAPVEGATGFAHIGAGWCYSMLLGADGSFCGSGINTWGQLGNGTSVNSTKFGCLAGSTLKSTGSTMQAESEVAGPDKSFISQNYPNPATDYTMVTCYLAEENANASIKLYNISHVLLKQYTVENTGESQVTINLQDLPAGMYFYTLESGGVVMDEKKLVLIR
jgi:alpha-tubulin suppressor-like RCC1 family protein